MPDRDEFFKAGRKRRAVVRRIVSGMLMGNGGVRRALRDALRGLLGEVDGLAALRTFQSTPYLPSLEQVGNKLVEPWLQRARLGLGPEADPRAVIAEVCRALLLGQVVEARGGVLDELRLRGEHPWHHEGSILAEVAHVSREAASFIIEDQPLSRLDYPKAKTIAWSNYDVG